MINVGCLVLEPISKFGRPLSQASGYVTLSEPDGQEGGPEGASDASGVDFGGHFG